MKDSNLHIQIDVLMMGCKMPEVRLLAVLAVLQLQRDYCNRKYIICSNFILFKSHYSSLSKANLRCHFGLREKTVTFI